MTIHERLREFIFFSKKNVSELAKEINVSQAALNNVVNGKNLPSSTLLIQLFQSKKLSINWLLTGHGDMIVDSAKDNNGKKIIQGDGNNVEVGNNTTNSNNKNSNNVASDIEKIKSLEKEVEMLRKTIADKDKIIKLLENISR